jgi:hypothetical protein
VIKRDQIEKEIKELELQLKLKRKELRSLGRKPGKRGGSWFLQNPQDWDKIFKDFEKLSIEVERKSTTNSLKPDSIYVYGFKESCEKHGYKGVEVSNLQSILSKDLQDSKNKFFIRFKKTVIKIIEGRKKIREQIDNEKWKLFESQMKEHSGDIKKVDRSLGRFILNNQKLSDSLKELRRKHRNENWYEFKKECKKRYSDFRNLGLEVTDSLYLSGVGRIRVKDRESVYFLNEEKEFHKKVLKEYKLDSTIDFSPRNWEHFNKQKEYIELIEKIGSTYKFQKGWDTGTNRKQWNIDELHFQKPDYRRIFNERIEVTINRETTELERIKEKIDKNEKRGFRGTSEVIELRKKKQNEIRSRQKESDKKLSPYKYPSREDIVNDPDFFVSLEKILRRLRIYNLGTENKELHEQVGCSSWMWRNGVIYNEDLRKTYDLLIDKLRSENLVKQLKSLDNKHSDLIVRSSKGGKIFYDIKNEIVVMDCNFCGEKKPKENFPISSTHSDKNSFKCFSCMKGESGRSRPGEKRNGKIIKKYDSRGVLTHNRCTSCDEFKLKNKFNHKWRGSSVCNDCYVELPNNHLTRKGEFNSKGDRLRIYNSHFNVTHKRCNTCNDMKVLDEFNKWNGSKIDGKGGTCRICLNKSRKELV